MSTWGHYHGENPEPIDVEFRREELARKFAGYLLKVSYANIAPSTQAAIDYIIEKEQNA